MKRSRWWRWTLLLLAFAGALLGVLAVPLAVTTMVTPPQDPDDPVTVFLLDHGVTPSLVLPTGAEGLVRFAYGDWNWYALRNTGPIDGVLALFWPTQGALGRQSLAGGVTEDNVRRQTGAHIEHLYSFEVPAGRVGKLRQQLESAYAEKPEPRVFSQDSALLFVHHPQRYTYFRNSNHVLAGWLRELGCEVSGPAYTSRWSVRP